MGGRLDAYLNSPAGGEPTGSFGGVEHGSAGAAPSRMTYQAHPHEPINCEKFTAPWYPPKDFADKFKLLDGALQVAPKEKEACACSQAYRDSCVQSVCSCCHQFEAGGATGGEAPIPYYHCASTGGGGLAYVGGVVVDVLATSVSTPSADEPSRDYGKEHRKLDEQFRGNKFELDREVAAGSLPKAQLEERRKKLEGLFVKTAIEQLSAMENDADFPKDLKRVLVGQYQNLMKAALQYFDDVKGQIAAKPESPQHRERPTPGPRLQATPLQATPLQAVPLTTRHIHAPSTSPSLQMLSEQFNQMEKLSSRLDQAQSHVDLDKIEKERSKLKAEILTTLKYLVPLMKEMGHNMMPDEQEELASGIKRATEDAFRQNQAIIKRMEELRHTLPEALADSM